GPADPLRRHHRPRRRPVPRVPAERRARRDRHREPDAGRAARRARHPDRIREWPAAAVVAGLPGREGRDPRLDRRRGRTERYVNRPAMMEDAVGGAPDPITEPAPPLNRMVMAVLALIGVLISIYMLMYHLGLLGSIMCGTGGCETVQNSPWASFLGVPVPLLGLFGYGALLAAALLGLRPG